MEQEYFEKENDKKEKTAAESCFTVGEFRCPILLFILFFLIGCSLAWIKKGWFETEYHKVTFSTRDFSEKTKKTLLGFQIYVTDRQLAGVESPLFFKYSVSQVNYSCVLPAHLKRSRIDFIYKSKPESMPLLRDFTFWGKGYSHEELKKVCDAKSNLDKNAIFLKLGPDFFDPPTWRFHLNLVIASAFCWTLLIYGIWFLLLQRNVRCGSGHLLEKKESSVFFVILAGFMLVLPPCSINERSIDKVEKRYLNKFPENSQLALRKLSSFMKKWEAAYEDRFYGREYLIHIKNFLFPKDGNPRVMIGKNDFYFLVDSLHNEWNSFANTVIYPESEMRKMGNTLNLFHELAEKRNKTFIFLMVPDKCRIYGEYVPYINKARPDSECNAEKLIRFFRDNYSFSAIYTRTSLLEQKKAEPSIVLYQHEDTHWTSYGAYYGGYLPVIKLLNSKGFDIPVYQPVWRLVKEKRGDLSWMLGKEKNEYSYLKDIETFYHENQRDIQNDVAREARFYNSRGVPLKVVMYRDSFMEKGGHFFAQTFQEVVLFWRSPREEDLQELESADIIIYESVERFTGFYFAKKTLAFPWEDK